MLYDVLLGIDRAAHDTHRRMNVQVLAGDRLSAAIAAEQIGDNQVREPQVEYTHAINVRPVRPAFKPRPATAAIPLAA
jgi:hypothetical protein